MTNTFRKMIDLSEALDQHQLYDEYMEVIDEYSIFLGNYFKNSSDKDSEHFEQFRDLITRAKQITDESDFEVVEQVADGFRTLAQKIDPKGELIF